MSRSARIGLLFAAALAPIVAGCPGDDAEDSHQRELGGTDGGTPPEKADAVVDGGPACELGAHTGSAMALDGQPCRECPGLECEAGETCTTEFHSGGPATTSCHCVDGRFQCCTQTQDFARCDHGGAEPPPCPAEPPEDTSPCDARVACSYDSAPHTVFCNGSFWVRYFSPGSGP